MSVRPLRSRGFTLVEILVALTIFGSVAALAFGAFSFATREQEHLTRSIAVEMAAAACLERMARDLSSAYVTQPPAFTPPKAEEAPSEFRIIGESDSDGRGFGRLQFASAAHVSFEQAPRKGIARIGYYAQAAENDEYVLRRSDSLFPTSPMDETAQDPVLCEHLKSAAFSFYDRDGDVSDHWDSASEATGYASPVAVRIVLEVQNGEKGRMLETTIVLPVHREPEQRPVL